DAQVLGPRNDHRHGVALAHALNAEIAPAQGAGLSGPRPRVAGKFLYAGESKLWLKGVTYGTFRPRADGDYPDGPTLAADFAAMTAAGVNTVRVYTVPPRSLLDAAQAHGLRVLVGLPWEQHVTFLGERGRAADIEARVRAGARRCAGHPALLGYAV